MTVGSSSARRAASTPPSARERLGGGGAELERLVGQQRVHVLAPLSSALDTIIRCTSIVPDATVAAWA